MGISYQPIGEQMKKSLLLQRIYHDLYNLRLVLLIFLIYAVTTQLIFHTMCPFAIVLGFPCPGCGMTRAVLFMLSGKPFDSLYLHPLALPWPALLLYLCFFRYIKGRRAPLIEVFTISLSLITLFFYCYRLSLGTLPEVPGPGLLHLVSHSFS